MNNNEKKNGTSVLAIPFLIFKYAYIGVKAVTIDLYKEYFVSTNEIQKKSTIDIESEISEYARIKNAVKKKKKKYKVSEKRLAKLQHEKTFFLQDLENAGSIRQEVPQIYLFKIREPNGRISQGTMRGLSKLDINSFLLSEGNEVFNIETSKWINIAYAETSIIGSGKLSDRELIFFLAQLSTYLKAGLTLSNSIAILSKQMSKDPAKARIFQSMSFEISLGQDFSTSLEKQDQIFPPLLINMVRAAEASGTIIETLEDMVSYYTEVNTTKRQMKSAVAYPITILVFACIIITFIMMYIVPQFTDIYANNGSEVTGITKFVINASDFIQNNIFNMVLCSILGIVAFIYSYKKIKVFRNNVQIVLMKTPIVRDVIIFNEVAIFSKTFSSLMKNNVYITESMDILSKITTNEVYKGILFETINHIMNGDKISEAFSDHWAVPDAAYYMIVTGESTGDLAHMMDKVSQYYQESHKTVVNNLKTLIEPLLTAILAVVVGMIIIAIIVPMYGAYNDVM